MAKPEKKKQDRRRDIAKITSHIEDDSSFKEAMLTCTLGVLTSAVIPKFRKPEGISIAVEDCVYILLPY